MPEPNLPDKAVHVRSTETAVLSNLYSYVELYNHQSPGEMTFAMPGEETQAAIENGNIFMETIVHDMVNHAGGGIDKASR
jgi:hypothetical protein